MLFGNNRCCDAVRSAILATAWLLVHQSDILPVDLPHGYYSITLHHSIQRVEADSTGWAPELYNPVCLPSPKCTVQCMQ